MDRAWDRAGGAWAWLRRCAWQSWSLLPSGPVMRDCPPGRLVSHTLPFLVMLPCPAGRHKWTVWHASVVTSVLLWAGCALAGRALRCPGICPPCQVQAARSASWKLLISLRSPNLPLGETGFRETGPRILLLSGLRTQGGLFPECVDLVLSHRGAWYRSAITRRRLLLSRSAPGAEGSLQCDLSAVGHAGATLCRLLRNVLSASV